MFPGLITFHAYWKEVGVLHSSFMYQVYRFRHFNNWISFRLIAIHDVHWLKPHML